MSYGEPSIMDNDTGMDLKSEIPLTKVLMEKEKPYLFSRIMEEDDTDTVLGIICLLMENGIHLPSEIKKRGFKVLEIALEEAPEIYKDVTGKLRLLYLQAFKNIFSIYKSTAVRVPQVRDELIEAGYLTKEASQRVTQQEHENYLTDILRSRT